MEEEIYYHLALILQKNYGCNLRKRILDHYGSAKAFFKDTKRWENTPKLQQRPIISSEMKTLIENEMRIMQQHDIRCCVYTDEEYPQRLRNCTDAPTCFFFKGEKSFNKGHHVAIVGTRMSTSYGRDAVKKITSDCAGYEITITSGLANGIDTAAHEEAIHNSLNTIAVMGTGFGTIYPAGNRALAQRIIDQGGTIISEYFFNSIPDKINFPKRNRIIAGMSDATIVIETAKKGGSIITAQIAHSYNRDVFAVPGPIDAPMSEGCNELIRKNLAAVICSGQHLIEMMGWNHEPQRSVQRSLFVELSDEELPIYNLILNQHEISIDDISLLLNDKTPSQIAGILLHLELKGVIQCKPGKIYAAV